MGCVRLERDPAAAANAAALSGCEVRGGHAADHRPRAREPRPDLHESRARAPSRTRAVTRSLPGAARPGRETGGRLSEPRRLTARVYGKHSCVWDPPRHLTIPAVRPCCSSCWGSVRLGTGLDRSHACASRIAARARQSRTTREAGFGPATRPGGRGFASLERLLVALGRPVGEEIIVVAHGPARRVPGRARDAFPRRRHRRFNTRNLLRRCLQALRDHPPKIAVEVMVGTMPPTTAVPRWSSASPSVRLLRSASNEGYGVAATAPRAPSDHTYTVLICLTRGDARRHRHLWSSGGEFSGGVVGPRLLSATASRSPPRGDSCRPSC